MRKARITLAESGQYAAMIAVMWPALVHPEEMAAGIAGSRLQVPNCGHLSTLEQPGLVTRTLVQWLGG